MAFEYEPQDVVQPGLRAASLHCAIVSGLASSYGNPGALSERGCYQDRGVHHNNPAGRESLEHNQREAAARTEASTTTTQQVGNPRSTVRERVLPGQRRPP